MTNLDTIFDPKSIAIVGVSQSPTKLGSVILNNILSSNYQGKIYPVNPKYVEVQGYICYDKVSSIPSTVDLACIVVPKDAVKDIVLDCAHKGVKGVVIISAGFGETGEAGRTLENEITEIAKKSGMRILGPNCLGFITPYNNCNVSFAASTPKAGNVAFISQSGAICTALLDMAIPEKLGFSHFISIGNKPDISEIDLLPYIQTDPNVKVISGYLEEVSQGRNLLSIYNYYSSPKPFILLKPGRTKASKQAMQSHTGAMIGEREVFETAMKQNGIISVDSISELFSLIKGFSRLKPIMGKRIAVVTNAGGPGVIAADEIYSQGMEIASISEESKQKLKELLPEAASINNPVDILGEALADRYVNAMQILSNDPNIDIILVLLTPQYVTQIYQTAEAIVMASQNTEKTVVPVFLGNEKVGEGEKILNNNGIACFKDISEAIKVLSHMYEFEKWKTQKASNATKRPTVQISSGRYHNEINAIMTDKPTALPEELIDKVIKEVGIPLPPQKLCRSIDECLAFAKPLFPVVMKVPNSIIMHKTDSKALILNITDDQSLINAYMQLTANTSNPNVLVQKQMKAKEELIVGVKRDGNSEVYKTGFGFGHSLLFGTGGIYTEIYKDISQILLPATIDQIIDGIIKTKVASIIAGSRGQKQLAARKLMETISAVQNLVLLYPEIQSLDLNPLFIDEDNVWAVDIKIIIQK